MQDRKHRYRVTVVWTGNGGSGTSSYRAYSRAHEIRAAGKPSIAASSDPAFRGDATRWNPEELLVAALAACHQLWYLHLCADAGVTVLGYEDTAEGLMHETADGGGRFERVLLQPRVTISRESDPDVAAALHDRAHELCFIASSVAFPVGHDASTIIDNDN